MSAPAIHPGLPWFWSSDCPEDMSSWDALAWTVTDHHGAVLLHLTTDDGLEIVNEHAADHRHGSLLIEGEQPHAIICVSALATRQLPPSCGLRHQLTNHKPNGDSVPVASGHIHITDPR